MARSPPRLGWFAPTSGDLHAAPLGYLTSAYLLLLPFSAALLAASGFATGVPITRWHLPAAAALAIAGTWGVARAERRSRRDLAIAIAAGTALLLAAGVAAHLLLDLSYDGQAYHQSSIRQLASGWNPVARSLGPADTTHGLWLNHYVRAVELGAATIAAASGSLEAGKAFGLGLAVATTLLCATALRCAGVRRGPAGALSAIATANPIVISQLATFYVDGQLALLFTSALALATYALVGQVRTAPYLLAVALALLANVKFTGTVYAALLLAGYLVVALRRRPGPEALRPALIAAIATLAVGWEPLVVNAATHGHPFHPVAGPSRVDGLSGQTPSFRHPDPLRRFIESTFSESSAARVVPSPKLPFVVHRREVAAMAVADVRVGGFGPLFALALTLGTLGALGAAWRGGAGTGTWLAVAAGVLGTALVNPGAWWARFVPQAWIAAVLLCAAVAVTARRAPKALGIAALSVLSADAALVAWAVAREQVATQSASAAQLRELARHATVVEVVRGEFEAVDVRVARAGLMARYVPPCDGAQPLVGTYASYCPAVPASSAGAGSRSSIVACGRARVSAALSAVSDRCRW